MALPTHRQLAGLARSILLDPEDRPTRVAEFVRRVERLPPDLPSGWDERVFDILVDLGYDLSYYDPEKAGRRDEEGYFGDGELESLLGRALEKLEKEGKNP